MGSFSVPSPNFGLCGAILQAFYLNPLLTTPYPFSAFLGFQVESAPCPPRRGIGEDRRMLFGSFTLLPFLLVFFAMKLITVFVTNIHSLSVCAPLGGFSLGTSYGFGDGIYDNSAACFKFVSRHFVSPVFVFGFIPSSINYNIRHWRNSVNGKMRQ